MAPSCVVLTFITHASTHVARCQVYGHVEVAAVGVPMALALLGEGREGQGKGLLRDHIPKVGGPSATLGSCHRPAFWGGDSGTLRLQYHTGLLPRTDCRGGLRESPGTSRPGRPLNTAWLFGVRPRSCRAYPGHSQDTEFRGRGGRGLTHSCRHGCGHPRLDARADRDGNPDTSHS